MFDADTHTELKALGEERDVTQASLVSALVRFALDTIDDDQLAELDLVPRKRRGRKPGSTNKETVTVVEETFEDEDEAPTELEEVVNRPFEATA